MVCELAQWTLIWKDYVDRLYLVTWALKAENFLQLIAEEKVRKIGSVRRAQRPVAGLEMVRPHAKECRRVDLYCQPWGKVVISSTTTGTEFSYNLNVRGSRFFSRASSWESKLTPWFQLCTTLRRTAEPAWHFGLQNCEIMNGCCQLLSVCWSVTAAIEDKDRGTEHQSDGFPWKKELTISFRAKFCQNFQIYITDIIRWNQNNIENKTCQRA